MRQRTPHILAKNSRSAQPRNLIFVDCETTYERLLPKSIKHSLRLGVAYFWRRRQPDKPDLSEWVNFKSQDQFWNWATSKARAKAPLYLISHNLIFDVVVLDGFRQLAQRGWMLRGIYEQGTTTLIKWGFPTKKFKEFLASGGSFSEFKGRRWQKSIKGVDNANLFPGKLEDWGRALNFKKLKMPLKSASDKRWFIYCMRDVEILIRLWQGWFDFLDKNDLGNFRPTIGSQAFAAFRHRFLHNKIYIHNNEEALALEREAYHGGRSQNFFVGKLPPDIYYKLDVNSMYPYVMRQFSFPTRLIKIKASPSLQDLEEELKSHCIIARVEIESPEPVFPLRGKHRIVFPVGRFTASLCSPELKYALEHGYIRSIFQMAVYAKRRIFVSYVDFFYALKVHYSQSNDLLRRQIAKLFLNSLYGKFGQRGFDDRLIANAPLDEFCIEYGKFYESEKRYSRITAGGSVIQKIREGESYDSFPAIAAHVTAHARIYLWKLMQKAGRKNYFYVDTDSLLVNQKGFDNLSYLIDPDKIGFLKVEKSSSLVILKAPKSYRIGDDVKQKGIPKNAREIARDTYEVVAWPSFKGLLKAGLLDSYYNRIINKKLQYRIESGVELSSGWIRPFILPLESHLVE